jgi:hypothetical protein
MKNIILLFIIVALFASCQSKTAKKETLAEKVLSKIATDTTHEAMYDNPVNSLGIGLIKAPQKFDIYDDSLLTKKYQSVSMTDAKFGITPKYFKPDYGIMHFVCISQNAKAYKVLVNRTTEKYLPKTKGYDFITWGNYITSSTGIRTLYNEGGKTALLQQLQTEPDGKGKPMPGTEKYEMFCPMQVKGDWVQVQFDCFYNTDNNKHEGEPCHKYISQCKSPVKGWLQWRKDEKVLIDIFFD